jgi:hypothetical protein
LRNSTTLLVRLALVLYVAWAGIALARETAAAAESWGLRQGNAYPCFWRLGMAPVDRLRRCLAGVEGLLPRDTVAVFTSRPALCDAEFYRWRWASYLLPRLLLTRPDDYHGRQQASYVITYRRLPDPLPGCNLVFVRQLDGGRVYRIDRR